MTLQLALSSALSGLDANQRSLAVTSNNIANANTEGYSRQTVEQSARITGSFSTGVEVEGVSRKIDEYLIRAIRGKETDIGRFEALSDYMERIQVLLGEPGGTNSLDESVETFFNSLQMLADTPERTSAREGAVNSGVVLANRISTLAKDLEDLRYQADQDLEEAFSTINFETRRLYNLNIAINTAYNLGQDDLASLYDQRDKALEKIGSLIDIETFIMETGEVHVFTAQGKALLDYDLHRIDYRTAPSVSTLIDDGTLASAEIYTVDLEGNIIGSSEELVSSGAEDTVSHRIEGGRVKGLLDLRDVEIPGILEQLDTMASVLRDELNAIHNDGSGYPGAEQLTGTRFVKLEDESVWEGAMRIGVLGEDGEPLANPFANVTNVPEQGGRRPMTLDFGFSSGGDIGRHSVETIIDEINARLEAKTTKVSLNNMNDIKLVSTTDSTGGNYTFDFDLENISDETAQFEVTQVSVDGAPPVATPLGPIDVNPGERIRTGDNVVGMPASAFSVGPLAAGAHTVDVTLQVTDASGFAMVSTYTFDVTYDPLNEDVKNDRYVASAATGGAFMEVPQLTKRLASAQLVDADGNPVGANEGGYLQITADSDANTGEQFRLHIDELDSKETGLPADTPPQRGSDRGFSHFFELNNFFVSNDPTQTGDTLANSAINMDVSDFLIDDSSRITTGQLEQTKQTADPNDATLYTYERTSGDNRVVQRLAKLGITTLDFDAAGGLPSTTLTISGYSAEFLAFASSKAVEVNNDLEDTEILRDSLKQRSDAISGVNLDEEMANTVLYQNAYNASARIVSITAELFDSLINAT